jgi:biotin carboxyl carrier protein
LRATLDGWPVTLSVMDELCAEALQGPGAAAGSGSLTADIPGLVVDIRVVPGQAVQKGEALIVVEAMKMQNELTAGVTGTVERVAVAVGQSVNPGDILVVITPPAAE